MKSSDRVMGSCFEVLIEELCIYVKRPLLVFNAMQSLYINFENVLPRIAYS